MMVQIKDKMFSTAELAKETGIGESVILTRLQRGWDLHKTLSTPVGPYKTFDKPRYTKDLASRELDETSIEDVPPELAKRIKEFGFKGSKYGLFARGFCKKWFDGWFKNVWLKEKHRVDSIGL